jgi:Uma2 family endonuclease
VILEVKLQPVFSIPNLLEAILALAWHNRNDWFFGVDMGIYYAPSQPALVPQGGSQKSKVKSQK